MTTLTYTEIRDEIESLGIGNALATITPDTITDETLRRLWVEADEALKAVERHLDSADNCIDCDQPLGSNMDEAHELWEGRCPDCVPTEGGA